MRFLQLKTNSDFDNGNDHVYMMDKLIKDLPVVSATYYKAPRTVKLDIKDGGYLICRVVSMAKYSLHALEFKELGELNLPAQGGSHLTGLGVHFTKKARFEELLSLGGLSAQI